MRTSSNCKLRAKDALVIPAANLGGQWKRLRPHLPAQRYLTIPKVAWTQSTIVQIVIGRMIMQHQRTKGSITQPAFQDALLQAQSCRHTEQQRCVTSYLQGSCSGEGVLGKHDLSGKAEHAL